MRKISEPLTICMLVFNDVVYDSRVLKEAASLAKGGYDVTILALHNTNLKYLELCNGFKILRLIVLTRIFKSKILLPFKFLECSIRMFIVASILKADFYHCHDIGPMIAAWFAARVNRVKLIYDSHELEYDRNLSMFFRTFNRYYERLFINKVNHIIVSDGKYRAKVMAEKNNCKVPMTFVMNCPPRIKLTEKDTFRIREELKIPETKKIVVYIGKSMPGRGIKRILLALSRLNNIVLVLIGKYNDSQIDEWEEKFRLKNRIKSIGPFHYSEVIKVISGADLGLVLIKNTCLSYYYSTPTKLFDCMAAGVPVMTSNFPAMENIVLNNSVGPIGGCVDPSRPNEIAKALIKIIDSDPAEYNRMKINAQNLHLGQYNWENQERKLFTVYDSICSN
ncbi:MAG: glycosyltransferase [Bacteroidetes bacterium]|nr:glycosyltransferase [Bacteroidota bacterium]